MADDEQHLPDHPRHDVRMDGVFFFKASMKGPFLAAVTTTPEKFLSNFNGRQLLAEIPSDAGAPRCCANVPPRRLSWANSISTFFRCLRETT